MQLKNGDIFAEHYQLKKLLGVGSFGEVWLARNILADVDVAIKLYGLLDDNGIKDFRGRKINCVMRRFFPSSSVGDRPAPRGCTSTPDERKVTTI